MNQLNEPKIGHGSDEWCAFPSLNIPPSKPAVDFWRQKTMSMHADSNIKTLCRDDKEKWVSFWSASITRQTAKLRFTVKHHWLIQSHKKLKWRQRTTPGHRTSLSLGDKLWGSRSYTHKQRHNGITVCCWRRKRWMAACWLIQKGCASWVDKNTRSINEFLQRSK